jgi:hypothetical protein
VIACARTFAWPPSVTRRESFRDLNLILKGVTGVSD